MHCGTAVLSILLAILFENNVYLAAMPGITYNVKLKGIEPYEDIKDPVWLITEMKLKKINKTHFAINGLYSVLRDNIPTDDLLMSFHAAQKKSNGYQESALIQLINKNYCDLWNNEQLIFPTLKKSINATDYKCPPAKGHYAITNYIPDTSKIPPNVPEGLWKYTFEYFQKDKLVCGYKVYAEVIKESITGGAV
ncbi:uncharacterized protein LOC123290931 [Chrysoperla carnea]|uniref:uncharacterized protein LOC123290931 n=1 Tax=Chrysoperla carnea TaxID=189513 RepID=UPI001D095DC8|nr:uncharacterized protein LOC123290931 [Chrysoperla carnea]